jgi:hypothetical protein
VVTTAGADAATDTIEPLATWTLEATVTLKPGITDGVIAAVIEPGASTAFARW